MYNNNNDIATKYHVELNSKYFDYSKQGAESGNKYNFKYHKTAVK